VGEVAAHRRAVAHQRIGDHARGVEQDGVVGAHDFGALQHRLARPAADAQGSAFLANVLQARDAPDVDQVLRGSEPQLEQRQEALSAGDHLGRIAELRQQRDRLGQRGRGVIVERSRIMSSSFVGHRNSK